MFVSGDGLICFLSDYDDNDNDDDVFFCFQAFLYDLEKVIFAPDPRSADLYLPNCLTYSQTESYFEYFLIDQYIT